MRLEAERGFILIESGFLKTGREFPKTAISRNMSRGRRPVLQRMWNFSFTTRPSRERQRYQAETSFIGTHRRSSLR